MNNTPSPINIETKTLSRDEANKSKSLIPAVAVCMTALVLLLAAFYFFLRTYNRYTFKCSTNEDGVSCTVTAAQKRALLPIIYFPDTLDIPETVNGFTVTAIAPDALKGLDKIKKITVPEAVSSIGAGAFAACSDLESAKLPSSLAAIPENLFKDNISLKNVVFGGKEAAIGKSAFEGCSSLASLTIPESVQIIESRAFGYCTSLEEIKLPSALTSIGEEAFFGCESLKFMTVPHSVKTVGAYAFRACIALEAINLGSVENLGAGAFLLCSSLKNITVPEKVIYIDDKTFSGCTSLASVSLPRGLRGIGERNFENCKMLTDIKYGGTKTEWSNVGLDSYWSVGSHIASVSCTDGKVDL